MLSIRKFNHPNLINSSNLKSYLIIENKETIYHIFIWSTTINIYNSDYSIYWQIKLSIKYNYVKTIRRIMYLLRKKLIKDEKRRKRGTKI